MSYSRESVWTGAELEALRAHFPHHGPGWDGWAEALPGRTWQAIRLKAGRLGLCRDGRRPRRVPEPTPAAWMDGCPHAAACRMQWERLEGPFECDGLGWMEDLARLLGCGEDCECAE